MSDVTPSSQAEAPRRFDNISGNAADGSDDSEEDGPSHRSEKENHDGKLDSQRP